MAIKTIDDTILQGIAEEIQEKDGGGKMLDTEMRGRIAALPTDLISKTITENGVYNASSDNVDGYDVVTVDVPGRNTLDELYANTLEVANIPSATAIPNSFFQNKTNLKAVIMPNVTIIGQYCFADCTNLALTTFPNGIEFIYAYAFAGCTGIPYIDVSELDHIPHLVSWYAFDGTTFPFYFRDQQQLDEWASATNWSAIASRFQIKPNGVS